MGADYFAFKPRFWNGRTGRELRAFAPHTRLLAIYLFTCPSSNDLGLYAVSLATIANDIAEDRKTILASLEELRGVGFSLYDEDAEEVFVPEMARYQLGETITTIDKRHRWLCKELARLTKHVFFSDFVDHYREAFHLPDEMQGELPIARSAAKIVKPRPRSKDTWITPFAEAWEAKIGTFPVGKSLKPLGDVCDRNGGAEAVVPVWLWYIDHQDPQYASAQNFATKFAHWRDQMQGKATTPARPKSPQQEAYDRAQNEIETYPFIWECMKCGKCHVTKRADANKCDGPPNGLPESTPEQIELVRHASPA